MKEKRSYKRFDLISVLAVLGVLVVLGFQSIFVFELYGEGFEIFERFFPSPEAPSAQPALQPEPTVDPAPRPDMDAEPVG